MSDDVVKRADYEDEEDETERKERISVSIGTLSKVGSSSSASKQSLPVNASSSSSILNDHSSNESSSTPSLLPPSSSSSSQVKRHWIGPEFKRVGVAGNDIEKTNVPDLRVQYRHDALINELSCLFIENESCSHKVPAVHGP